MNPNAEPARRVSITDSPWFWVELFSIVALLATTVIGPKFQQRQGQIERRFEGRQQAYSRPAGDPTAEPQIGSRRIVEDNRVSLGPLQLILAGVMLLAAVMLARSRRRIEQAAAVDEGTGA